MHQLASLGDFAKALLSNWMWFMSTGPFAFDKLCKLLSPDRYEKFSSKYIPPALKQKAVIFLAFAGVIVACFLSFDQERELALSPSRSTLLDYEPIDADKLRELSSKMKGIAPKPTIILGFEGNSSAARVANQLSQALKNAEILSPVQKGWLDDDDEVGIKIEVKDRFNLSVAEKAVLDAFHDSLIDVELRSFSQAMIANEYTAGVFVCPRGSR